MDIVDVREPACLRSCKAAIGPPLGGVPRADMHIAMPHEAPTTDDQIGDFDRALPDSRAL